MITKKNLKSNKDEKTKENISNIKNKQMICDQVNQVKDFILFKVIYDESYRSDQQKLFAEAFAKLSEIYSDLDSNENIDKIYEKNKKIFDKIKDILSNNESKADQLIDQIKDHNNSLLKNRTEIIQKIRNGFKKYIFLFRKH